MRPSRFLALAELPFLISCAAAASALDLPKPRALFSRQVPGNSIPCTCPAPATTVYVGSITATTTVTVATSGIVTTTGVPVTEIQSSTSTISLTETAPTITVTACPDSALVKRQTGLVTGTSQSFVSIFSIVTLTQTTTVTTTFGNVGSIPPQSTYTSTSVVFVTTTSTSTPVASYCPPTTYTTVTTISGTAGAVTVQTVATASGTTPGTIAVVIPSTYDTITLTPSGTTIRTATETSTVTQTDAQPGTVYVLLPNAYASSSVAAFSCPTNGFMVAVETGVPILYSVDVGTGVRTPIKSPLGDGTSINAIGYDVLDNTLYGVANYTPPRIIRIGADGSTVNVRNVPAATAGPYQAGDVDENGDFWISNAGREWLQVRLSDLAIVASGTATTALGVYDWAYVPGGGNYLYAITIDSGGRAYLNRFDRTAHNWAQVGSGYGAIYPANGVVGAVYASQDGYIYGSENSGGRVYRFSLDGSTSLYRSTGQPASSNDGAHCINNGAG